MRAALRLVPVHQAASVLFAASFMQDGQFVPNAEMEADGRALLDELARVAAPLDELHAARREMRAA